MSLQGFTQTAKFLMLSTVVFGVTSCLQFPIAKASSASWTETPFRHRAVVQNNESPYYKPEPSYAKWGKLAVRETKQRYPEAHVVDYLHLGRSMKSPGLVQESFKLWLRSKPREFGVFVTIVFDKNTEQVRSIQFRETPR